MRDQTGSGFRAQAGGCRLREGSPGVEQASGQSMSFIASDASEREFTEKSSNGQYLQTLFCREVSQKASTKRFFSRKLIAKSGADR